MKIKFKDLSPFIISFFAFHIGIFLIAFLSEPLIPKFSFFIFCISFLIMFYNSVYKTNNFLLKFASLFVYLGFYLKICLHAILSYAFVEAIGDFQGTSSEWNEFFYVSSIAAVAIALCAPLFKKLFKVNLDIDKSDPIVFKEFFIKNKHFVFIFLLVSSLTIALINTNLGITISGLAAITILPWPTNALIGFSLYMGLAILISVFAFYENRFTRTLKYTTILVLLEAFFSSVSILSRGLFLFHFLPYFICLWLFRKNLQLKIGQLVAICFVGGCLYLASGFLVTVTRSALYTGNTAEAFEYRSRNLFSFNNGIEDTSAYFSKYGQKLTAYRDQFLKLIADRWIGAEGVMAVVSYPHKDFNLIPKSLMRIPKVGERDVFEEINRSTYPLSKNYVFTSLPGPTAFFYYSGSYLVVFLGMIFLMTLFGFIQYLTQKLVPNVFLEFQTAFYFAIAFMQFGISPRPLVVSFIMLFTLLIFLKVVNIWARSE